MAFGVIGGLYTGFHALAFSKEIILPSRIRHVDTGIYRRGRRSFATSCRNHISSHPLSSSTTFGILPCYQDRLRKKWRGRHYGQQRLAQCSSCLRASVECLSNVDEELSSNAGDIEQTGSSLESGQDASKQDSICNARGMPSERENSCSGGDDSSSCDQTTSAAWEKSTKVKRRKGQNDEVGKEGLIVDGMHIGRSTILERLFWQFGKWLYRTWFAQEITGMENLPLRSGAFLLASNHSSHLDCGAIYVAAWAGGVKKVFALGARDYFFCHPFKAWFVTQLMRVIPFNRRGFSQREVQMLELIKDNSSPSTPAAILLFPEGTRSKDGSLQHFKAGVGFLAQKLDMPVVPVCVKGTIHCLPKGRTIPQRHRIKVSFGPALHISEYVRDAAVGNEVSSVAKAAELEPSVYRATQKKFTEDLKGSIADMLGSHGKRPMRRVAEDHHRAITDRLGGGKPWRLLGWLGYWVPLAGVIVTALFMAGLQSWNAGVGRRGYAMSASVFSTMGGASGLQRLLSSAVMVVLCRALVQWAWPILVMAPSEE